MKFTKYGPGIKITQSNTAVIKVVEGGGAARVVGVLILLGGAALSWQSFSKMMDLAFVFGVLLMLFGAAVATQRYVMTIDRLHGAWSYGGDVFFLISFKSRGLLANLGPVRINKLVTNPREHDMGEAIITYAISIVALNDKGVKEELRFGKHWSIEEAKDISTKLAEFLDKPVLAETGKE